MRGHSSCCRWQLWAAIFTCSKDGQDVVVLPPDTILALFNWCLEHVSRYYSIV